MKISSALLITMFSIVVASLNAQQLNGLKLLNDKRIEIYYSAEQEQRARSIAGYAGEANDFFIQLLKFKPQIKILVLSETDWSKHTNFPVYGMPHYKDDKTLIVASSDNDFWRSFLPPLDQMPPELAEKVRKAYTVNNKLTMQPFFDLLALHELGHSFHLQAGLTMQRKWMGELFSNMMLHTFIAEKHPELLPALTAFPQMVVGSGPTGFQFTTLTELENNYTLIATKHPQNYGWYQCKLHEAARRIYDQAGKSALTNLWKSLMDTTPLTDEQLLQMLNDKVHSSVADVMRQW